MSRTPSAPGILAALCTAVALAGCSSAAPAPGVPLVLEPSPAALDPAPPPDPEAVPASALPPCAVPEPAQVVEGGLPDLRLPCVGEGPDIRLSDGQVRSTLSYVGPPYTYLVDAAGRVVHVQPGQIKTEDQLVELIDAHLGVAL
jgi:hypothetical protein